MIRNPFKDKILRGTFDAAIKCFQDRHSDLFASDGQPHRLNGWASPFWRGYFNEPKYLVINGTPGHAMFRAGRACRKEFNVEFEHTGTKYLDAAKP